MVRKIHDLRPSGPPSEFPRSRLFDSLNIEDAMEKLRGGQSAMVSRGAYELRCIALREEDLFMAIPLISSTLRVLLNGRPSTSPTPRQSMTVPREGSSARVHLAECLRLAAKGGTDISEALPLMPLMLECQDIHVRNFSILALGYHTRNNRDTHLYVDLVVKHLREPIPMNREASVWMLKEYASKGKMHAHQVLLALGNGKEDDPGSADVRTCCLEILGGK